ncbi:hypothetical protein CUMW_162690 [Citrus unshiu]|nr:hypothetical protein CUMW_162690 [Citrus unshiu]
MEEIINIGKLREEMMSNLEPLTKLQVLYLKKPPNLKSVYWKAFPFPDKLPLDFQRAGQGKILIEGKEDWWKQHQSEDQGASSTSSTWMERFGSRSAGFSTTCDKWFVAFVVDKIQTTSIVR